ncbi:hypothetical protein F4802DRAFT_2191 [Xylaria palmicola]|nr:hypothetical protein F4802DRAFT_2191 [Xylaria palmicola]
MDPQRTLLDCVLRIAGDWLPTIGKAPPPPLPLSPAIMSSSRPQPASRRVGSVPPGACPGVAAIGLFLQPRHSGITTLMASTYTCMRRLCIQATRATSASNLTIPMFSMNNRSRASYDCPHATLGAHDTPCSPRRTVEMIRPVYSLTTCVGQVFKPLAPRKAAKISKLRHKADECGPLSPESWSWITGCFTTELVTNRRSRKTVANTRSHPDGRRI